LNNKPFFSVVIPCYNVADTILPTLESIRSQDFFDFEIIFVNDGSLDNTFNIVSNFSLSNVNIVVVDQDNKGLGAARNTGIKASSGKYIALLDADDTWFSCKLSKLHEIITQNSVYELFCHNEYITTNTGRILKKNYYGKSSTFEELIYNGNCLSPSAVVIQKELFQRVGYFSEDRNFHGVEDYDFWLRAALNNTLFFYIDNFLGNYIIHESNMSTTLKFINVEEKLILSYINSYRFELKSTYKIRKRLLVFYLRKLYLYLKILDFSYLYYFFADMLYVTFNLDNYLKMFNNKND
jgi:glycosyltransferase involved in cell wall biosynthesis